ncbi:MAG TPA: hypothetical protein VFQ05_17355, partial [Candidatus Eisenbacteria bacterium]|nr:hypothetical protein [Candidatus Eisenbacteria bacterium]
ADQEYYSHTLQLHFRSGTAQDLGCVTPACFHITNVVLMSYGEPDLHLSSAALVSNAVDWQGGIPVGCIFSSPTTKNSWGQIKALYR